MKYFLLIALLQVSIELVYSQKSVGCYYESWGPANGIDVKLCTHAYFAFYLPDANGGLTASNPASVGPFLALKSQNPNVKLIASIGGFTNSNNFATIASTPSKLTTFINSCLALIRLGFDGVDVDWEYPESNQRASHVNMLMKLKAALPPSKLLTIAAAAGSWRISESFDIAGICKYVDILNLMSYDLQWPYTVTGPNAPYSVVNAAVTQWNNGGCPLNKISLGLATYGYNFALASSAGNGVGASSPGGASDITYRDICIKLKTSGWTKKTADQTPYAYKGNEWISYDDVTSLTAKLNIVNSRGLHGAFFWAIDKDDYDNSCGTGKFPLVSAVSRALGVSTGATTTATTAAATTTGPSVTTATTPAATTTTKASSTITCTSDGFFAYPGDCTRYYRCVSGIIYYFTCAGNTGWNQAWQTCATKSSIPGCV